MKDREREQQKQKRNARRADKDKLRRGGRKKVCSFCAAKVLDIDYKDMAVLRRYVNEKNKIAARRSSGACARHQRALAAAVKCAREMALLPYCTCR
jgi:small subunit ribosomal protein S18